MLKKGNGAPEVCVGNLLSMVRGECPWERLKGLDARNVDMNTVDGIAKIQQDATWVIETYEPRAKLNGVNVVPVPGALGDFSVTADIRKD